jgi:hypothetical protein
MGAMRAASTLPFAFALAFTAMPACGGRTQLRAIPPADASLDAPADSPVDSPADAPLDAPRDAGPDAACDGGCDDGVACTHDHCDPSKGRCTHTPDDSLCPDTQLCSPRRGCNAFVYAVASDGHLYELGIPSGTLTDVGRPAAFTSDVALGHDSTLYLTDSYVLYALDRESGESTGIASILPLHEYNGLGTAPDGTLLATADVAELFLVDASSGASTTNASFPDGYRASGDVTAAGGRVYVTLATSAHPQSDTLAVVDLTSQTTTGVGDLGFRCVWGLATLGGALYGTTCDGRLIAIDESSGAAKQLAMGSAAYFGAAGR